jgi:MFS family permease
MLSLFGTWMQTTAQGYLVFQLTHSTLYLGYVGFAAGAPALVLSLYGGFMADRVPRRTLLLITQTTMMLLAFVLAGLTFLGIVQAWHIGVLAALLGTANAFDAPARQAFVSELVERDDLTSAIALNAVMFNAATAVGPAVAGITYAAFGPAWCFALNGLSFLAVISALWLIKIPPIARLSRPPNLLAGLREALGYAAMQPLPRTLILLVAMASLFGISLTTLMPAWAVSVLNGNAATNGLLQSSRGAGALAGAFAIAALHPYFGRGRMLTVGTFAFPALLLLFSTTRWLPLSLATLFMVGTGHILVVNLANVLLQSTVPEHLRGRLMSLFSLTLFGSIPVGALVVGLTARYVGVPQAVALSAVCALAISLAVYVFAPVVRRAR